MGLYRFSFKEAEGQKLGKAQLHDLNCSYKDLSQVLLSIKGKNIKQAKSILNDAIEMKKAIPFVKFAGRLGHRSELRGQRGKYPKKECKIAIQLLDNAVANAVVKGLDESNLIITHSASYKQNVLKRYRKFFAGPAVLGYGKNAIWSNYVLAWAELAVGEGAKKESKASKKEVKAPKAEVAKPKEAKPVVKKEVSSEKK